MAMVANGVGFVLMFLAVGSCFLIVWGMKDEDK